MARKVLVLDQLGETEVVNDVMLVKVTPTQPAICCYCGVVHGYGVPYWMAVVGAYPPQMYCDQCRYSATSWRMDGHSFRGTRWVGDKIFGAPSKGLGWSCLNCGNPATWVGFAAGRYSIERYCSDCIDAVAVVEVLAS